MYIDHKACGRRIQEMRRLHGYTQETLAEHLNTTRSHIGKIEIGKEGLSMDLYVELKAMFHTTLDYLVLGEDTPVVHVEEVKYKLQEMSDYLIAKKECL